MTKKVELCIKSAADKQKFADEVESLPANQQSDATVNFFAEKFGLQSKIITVTVPESGRLIYQHFEFRICNNTNKKFYIYRCVKKQKPMCPATIFVPKTAESGTQRFALHMNSDHTCRASIENFDEFGRSVHLNRLFEAVEILREAGADVDYVLDEGIDQEWVDDQDEDVQEAAEYIEECLQLFAEFESQFENEKPCKSTVYARFRVGVTDKSSFAERFNVFAKIGWRSGIADYRMAIERRTNSLVYWKKTIRFCAQNRPITEKDLHIPTNDIQTKISESQAKATEALIEELYVKLEDHDKLTLNELDDICKEKYRFDDVQKDHKAASFAFVKGLWHAYAFHLADYRPREKNGTITIDENEVTKRLKAVNSNDEEIDMEQLQAKLEEKDEQLADKDKLIQVLQDENNRLSELLARMQIETQNVTTGPSSSKKRKIR